MYKITFQRKRHSMVRRYDFAPERYASLFTLITFNRDTLSHMNMKRSNATQRYLRWR